MALETGRQIGPYRLDRRLGAGGMDVVYRAYDVGLQRAVAIKFLSDDLADAAARHRFQREAQTASALNHPHLLTIHDTGEFEGSQHLVMELMDGGTLGDWARIAKTGRRLLNCSPESLTVWRRRTPQGFLQLVSDQPGPRGGNTKRCRCSQDARTNVY